MAQLRHPLHLHLAEYSVWCCFAPARCSLENHCVSLKRIQQPPFQKLPCFFFSSCASTSITFCEGFYYRNDCAVPCATVLYIADLSVNQEILVGYERDLHVAFYSQKHDSYLCFSIISPFWLYAHRPWKTNDSAITFSAESTWEYQIGTLFPLSIPKWTQLSIYLPYTYLIVWSHGLQSISHVDHRVSHSNLA